MTDVPSGDGRQTGGDQRLDPRPAEVVDRATPIMVSVDGQPLEGFAGDTAASLLAAHGRRTFFGSVHEQRPGGIRRADRFDRSAWVWVAGDGLVPAAGHRVVSGDRLSAFQRRANTPLAVNPMVRWQLPGRAAVERLGARPGPPTPAWLASLRRGAGQREVAPGQHRRVGLAVIGGGHAGLRAALAAADEGAQVALIEADDWLGGRLRWAGGTDEQEAVAELAVAVARHPGVEVLVSTVAVETRVDGTVVTLQRRGETEQLGVLRAGAVILATGVDDRDVPFEGSHLPGVVTETGARRLLELWAVRPGTTALLVSDGRGEAALVELAGRLADAGVAVADQLVLTGTAARLEASGMLQLEEVGLPDGRHVELDLLVTSFGSSIEPTLVSGLGGVVTRLSGTGELVIGNLPAHAGLVGAVAGHRAGGATLDEIDGRAAATARRLARLVLDPPRQHRVVPPPPAVVVSGTDPSVTRPLGGLLDAALDLRLDAVEGFAHSTPVALERLVLTARRPGLGGSARTVLADLARSAAPAAEVVDLILAGGGPLGGPSLAAVGALDQPVLRRSPIVDLHRGSGARLVASDGWLDVADYGDPIREHEALAMAVGLRDRSAEGCFEVVGPRASALISRLTGHPVDRVDATPVGLLDPFEAPEVADAPPGAPTDVVDLTGHATRSERARPRPGPGPAAPTPAWTGPPPVGAVPADPYQVVRTGPHQWQVTPPRAGRASALEAELMRASLEHQPWEVAVVARHEDVARVRVTGPATPELLEAMAVDAVVGRRTEATVGELEAVISARRVDDVEIEVRADAGRALWAALLVAGERSAVCPVGLDAIERHPSRQPTRPSLRPVGGRR